MIEIRPESDLHVVEAIMCDPSISPKVSHDGWQASAINHPAVSYHGGYVDGEIVGIFVAVRFSRWEIEVHTGILPHALRHARELGRAFLDVVFADEQVQRATAYVMATLPSAANYCRKLGFVDEGRRRDACAVGGVMTDVIVLGMTRGDWALTSR